MSASSLHSAQSRPSSCAWLRGPAVWAGLSIVTMWLAVLFVGVFGGNIVNSTPGGTSSSVPVVVALLPFVLPATIVAARRGFTQPVDEEQQTVPHEQNQIAPAGTPQPPDLRTKIA